MPDLGLLRGLITLLTLFTFIGICWWAYRPANRVRFEEDGWLAFGDEEPQPVGEPQRVEKPQPVKAVADDQPAPVARHQAEEGQA